MLTLVSSSAYLLFKINHHAITLRRELLDTHKAIVNEKENLHVLKAEWSLLTSPQRIHELATKHLHLKTVQPSQVMRYNSDLVKEQGGK